MKVKKRTAEKIVELGAELGLIILLGGLALAVIHHILDLPIDDQPFFSSEYLMRGCFILWGIAIGWAIWHKPKN